MKFSMVLPTLMQCLPDDRIVMSTENGGGDPILVQRRSSIVDPTEYLKHKPMADDDEFDGGVCLTLCSVFCLIRRNCV